MTQRRSFLRRLLSSAMLLINIVAIIWLLLCYAASVISPREIDYISFFSLTTPFALLLNFIFVATWLLSARKWWALFSALPLALCWRIIPAVLGLHFFASNDWTRTDGSFKLMAWNVHAMGTFNTPNERYYAQSIIDFIAKESPDILCLPEYAVHADEKKQVNTPSIKSQNGYTEYHFTEDNDYGPAIRIGTAVFSRFPVVAYKAHPLGRYIYMVQCDIRIPEGGVVSVFVVHLQSFGLSDDDKALIEEAREQRNTDPISERSRSYIWKFNEVYKVRAGEAEMAAEIIRRCPNPVVVCGDFNDLPFSYTYTTIRGPLNDAFADKGTGFGRTYNRILPTLRIDHVLYDDALKVKAFRTEGSRLSDHNPVIVNFEYVGQAAE